MKLSIISVAALASIAVAMPSIPSPMVQTANKCISLARAANIALSQTDPAVVRATFGRYVSE